MCFYHLSTYFLTKKRFPHKFEMQLQSGIFIRYVGLKVPFLIIMRVKIDVFTNLLLALAVVIVKSDRYRIFENLANLYIHHISKKNLYLSITTT